MVEKMRLDQWLCQSGLCSSREDAKRWIMAGEVKVGDVVARKASQMVDGSVPIAIKERRRFVGRGGEKLEGALVEWKLDVKGLVCLDIGASTGGFTDCLLQRAAAKVYAFDVGHNQLAWKLRTDTRVEVREKFNARYMQPEDVGEKIDLVVIDVSFISLRKILPPAFSVLKAGGHLIALIKPQFELAREEVGKGGIVREEELRKKATAQIEHFVVEELQREWCELLPSILTGSDGNQEYLAWMRNK